MRARSRSASARDAVEFSLRDALDDLPDEAKTLFLGDDFVIKDETGQDRFFVDGKAFSLGNQLSFQDLSGTENGVHQPKVVELGAQRGEESPSSTEHVRGRSFATPEKRLRSG